MNVTAVGSRVSPPAARRRSRPAAWLIARLRAPWLDAELAADALTWRSPAHAARALQLTGRRSRRSLAIGLERLVTDADRRRRSLGAVVPPCREQVLHARPLILELAGRLRSSEPVDARGVARLKALLCDGSGPCYLQGSPDALTVALLDAARCLAVAA
jgi:hypothetical protein